MSSAASIASPWFRSVPVLLAIAMLMGGHWSTAEAATAIPVIISPTTATGTTGVAFSYQISATEDPTGFSASGLPSGLSLNPTTGLISGMPTMVGTGSVTIGATNGYGTGIGSVSITIIGASMPPEIVGPTTVSAVVGVYFTYQIIASNNPLNYSASGLPNGLALNTVTGQINGSPSLAGTWLATIGANNLQGSDSALLTIVVDSLPPGTRPHLTSSRNANGQVGIAFSYAIQATHAPTSYGAGNLPEGLTVNTTTGLITGTPTTSGVTDVTISATNASGTDSDTVRLSISNSDGTPPPNPPRTDHGRDDSSCGAGSGLSALLLAALVALQATMWRTRRRSV